jgi:hypothetical protein
VQRPREVPELVKFIEFSGEAFVAFAAESRAIEKAQGVLCVGRAGAGEGMAGRGAERNLAKRKTPWTGLRRPSCSSSLSSS